MTNGFYSRLDESWGSGQNSSLKTPWKAKSAPIRATTYPSSLAGRLLQQLPSVEPDSDNDTWMEFVGCDQLRKSVDTLDL
jgi:hypothetical protein